MRNFKVRTHPSKDCLQKEKQLAWALAEIAHANGKVDNDCAEMVGNRMIDNAAVALAAIHRASVAAARGQALCHPRENGATLFGLPSDQTFDCEWAAWANNTAVRELDMHDTFLAADYSHPGDTIPAILATAQQKEIGGNRFVLAVLTAYEIQISLVKGICLHEFKKDHIAHLAPAIAGGLGTLLRLETDAIFHAINQALHLSVSTRQSRKGEISSWKAFAPAFAGKLAIESVDRAMRGEKSPSPIYEGEEGVIAWMLGGPEREYTVPLPEVGAPCRSILESYTKEHSAEYQSQALIDIACEWHREGIDTAAIREVVIRTSHHTHKVIGTGANDPQKFDPKASRETLDHSAMYIFAVALEDGRWHHIDSYAPERAARPETVALWRKIRTEMAEEWTAAYHHPDPSHKSFGAEVVITMKEGTTLSKSLKNADAHPNGKRPFQRPEYISKFKTLTEGLITPEEERRFFALVRDLPNLSAAQLKTLNPQVAAGKMRENQRNRVGIF